MLVRIIHFLNSRVVDSGSGRNLRIRSLKLEASRPSKRGSDGLRGQVGHLVIAEVDSTLPYGQLPLEEVAGPTLRAVERTRPDRVDTAGESSSVEADVDHFDLHEPVGRVVAVLFDAEDSTSQLNRIW